MVDGLIMWKRTSCVHNPNSLTHIQISFTDRCCNITELWDMLRDPLWWEREDVDLGIHQPDWVNMKACRWIWVCVCVHLRHLDERGWAGCQRNTEGENTIRHNGLCVFRQWGFLCADLREFCCVSSSVGNMNINADLLSLVKALCCSRGAAVSNHFETWKDIDTDKLSDLRFTWYWIYSLCTCPYLCSYLCFTLKNTRAYNMWMCWKPALEFSIYE